MGMVRTLLCWAVVCFGVMGWSAAEEYPPVPMGHVLDESGLFDRHPERLVEISTRLMELEEKHEMPVYIAIYGGLLQSRIKQQTQGLHGAWVGDDEDGVVVVWDSDTRRLEFGLPVAAYYDLGGEDGPATRLPDKRMRPVLNEVMDEVEAVENKLEYVERLSTVLVARLDYMLAEDRKPEGVSTMRVVVATVFLGGILAGMGLCAGRLVRGVEEKPRRQCYFPEVLVGSRLGASFGGGRVAVIDYMREDEGEEDE